VGGLVGEGAAAVIVERRQSNLHHGRSFAYGTIMDKFGG